MTGEQHEDRAIIDWAAAGCPLGAPGENNESGDELVVTAFPGGVLVGVIDGLGHGAAAAHAARKAARVLTAHAGQPVQTLIERCHENLHSTRGAVMSLASINRVDSSITWVGVGNVDAILLRTDSIARSRHQALQLRGGIVGYQLPPLRATALAISPGDTLIMVTDGIGSEFMAGVNLHDSPRRIAESILTRYGKGTDDSLVVVARYLGGER